MPTLKLFAFTYQFLRYKLFFLWRKIHLLMGLDFRWLPSLLYLLEEI
jgi:hypothetical protein